MLKLCHAGMGMILNSSLNRARTVKIRMYPKTLTAVWWRRKHTNTPRAVAITSVHTLRYQSAYPSMYTELCRLVWLSLCYACCCLLLKKLWEELGDNSNDTKDCTACESTREDFVVSLQYILLPHVYVHTNYHMTHFLEVSALIIVQYNYCFSTVVQS